MSATTDVVVGIADEDTEDPVAACTGEALLDDDEDEPSTGITPLNDTLVVVFIVAGGTKRYPNPSETGTLAEPDKLGSVVGDVDVDAEPEPETTSTSVPVSAAGGGGTNTSSSPPTLTSNGGGGGVQLAVPNFHLATSGNAFTPLSFSFPF